MTNFIDKETKLIEEYDKVKPLLRSWGHFVDSYLLELLDKSGFNTNKVQIPPKFRLKSDVSLVAKAFYRNLSSSSPLKRIEDKVGTRIVVTTLEDVVDIKKIICDETSFWSVRESRSINKHLSKPKEFDYQSLHLNLTPSNKVEGFDNMSKSNRKLYICEVQIRTLLQHAFAEIAHDTIYKGPYGEDSKLVRVLSRGMALMEVTDEHFCQAYEIMREESTYETSFLNKLVKISNEKLSNEYFKIRDVDNRLTSELFQVFKVRNLNIEDISITLVRHKSLIIKALEKTQTYLVKQPVVILLIHLILTDAYEVKEKWYLEEEIMKDLFFKLGMSTRR